MRLIVAGSRSIDSFQIVADAIRHSPFFRDVEEIIHGDCREGVDASAKRFARLYGVKETPFPVTKEDWEKHGKAAGPIRNAAMAQYAAEWEGSALVAVWDGQSRGTRSMIERALGKGLDVYVKVVHGV